MNVCVYLLCACACVCVCFVYMCICMCVYVYVDVFVCVCVGVCVTPQLSDSDSDSIFLLNVQSAANQSLPRYQLLTRVEVLPLVVFPGSAVGLTLRVRCDVSFS